MGGPAGHRAAEDHRSTDESRGPWRTRIGCVPLGDSVVAGLRILRQALGGRLGPERIARTWTVLMKRLGYTKYVAQGGDWGALITQLMGAQAAPGLLGIHTNMPGAVPPDIDKAAFTGAPAPSGLSADEQHAYDRLVFFYNARPGYAQEMGTAHRRCTGSRIHPSASPAGSSTTTRAAMR